MVKEFGYLEKKKRTKQKDYKLTTEKAEVQHP